MLLLATFVKGLAVGFAIAAPVGPIGVLCVRRTIADGRASGLSTGLGAAAADAVYGAVAAFGVAAVSGFLVDHGAWLRGAGGAFLCALAVKTYLAAPAVEATPPRATALLGAFGSTFVLTLTNPTTIVSFVAIFAAVGLGRAANDGTAAVLLIGGVFLGSAMWWLGLSAGVGLMRGNFGDDTLRRINRFSGAVIALFGVLALVSVAL